MDAWFIIFVVFAVATLIAIGFSFYLVGELKAFPDEYRKAGSPSAFWNDWRTWSFLAYVLRGRFAAIPDASLVATFKIYRALEATRLTLVVALVVLGLAHDVFFKAGH